MEEQEKPSLPVLNVNLQFNYLPAFAQYILDSKLKEYCTKLLHTSRALDIPLLKYFKDIPDDKLITIGMENNREMLRLLINNQASYYITNSTKNWVANQLPVITRDQVIAEDITLVNYARRKVMRDLLIGYTQDLNQFTEVMEEVDRFTVTMDNHLFKIYFQIQREKIDAINLALQKREADLLEAQEIGQIGSFEWDLLGKDSKYTPQVFKIFEMDRAKELSTFLDDVHPDDRGKLSTALTNGLSSGNFECEYRYVKGSREKVIWSRGKVLFEDAKPSKMFGTIMDVTERHKIIQRLQDSEKLHKQAQSLTHIGNWSWSIDQDIVSWSDEMYHIYGLEPQSQQIKLEQFLSFIHPEDRERRSQDIYKSIELRHVEEYHFRIVTADGLTKVLRGRGEILTDKNNKPVTLMGTCQDVTKEFLLNKELGERERYLKQLLDNAPDAIIVIDDRSEIILWNPKTEEIFGWTSLEVIGRNLTNIIIPPRYRDAHINGMRRLLETGEARMLNKTIEISALNKKSEEFYISLTISKSVQAGKSIFISFIRDITREKKTQSELTFKTLQLATLNASLEEKNQELVRINKELESFNFIASHDLQEPLRKIRIYSNRMLEMPEKLPDPAKNYADKINQASDRMQNLIDDFLSFSKAVSAPQVFEPTDLMSVLEESKQELAGSLEEKHAIIEADQLPVIDGIPFQLKQLFANLIGNGIKYSKENTAPHITITASIVQGAQLKNEGGSFDKKYVKLSFADQGIGFEQKYASKIFELFQRLHSREKYSGTGIGLAICKKIAENHHGFIQAESDTGAGAVFLVYLPLHAAGNNLPN